MLWTQIGTPSVIFDHSSVVILYDGQQASDRSNTGFHPEDWLSPWDWAIGMSMALSRIPTSIPPGGFRCFIVDLLPAYWGTAARVRFKAIGGLAPWLRWYVPTSGDQTPTRDFSMFFHDLTRLSHVPNMNSSVLLTPEWPMFVQTWAGFFESPTHRHAIGNLIAPLILADGLSRNQGLGISIAPDDVTARFHSLLRTVGPASRHDHPKDGGLIDKRPLLAKMSLASPAHTIFGQPDRLRLILVDDQYDLGYDTIITRLLLGNEYEVIPYDHGSLAKGKKGYEDVQIQSIASPDLLLRWIQDAVTNEPDWSQPRVLGPGDIDILCLDLRLFTDSTPDHPSDSERDFLRKLVAFSRTAKLPLDRHPKLEFALAAASRRSQGESEELLGLCFLPLLINLVDPSLPIVLFSSTHQREVTDLLRDCPSIISTFAKPIITGYLSVDIAQQCASDLESALSQALRLHRVRIIWRLIVDLAQALRAKPCRIVERFLSASDDGTPEYTIDTAMIRILATEYQSLFLYGRFADALQIPDNLLEQIGAKFETPEALKNMNIMFLDGLRDSGKPWAQAFLRADRDFDTRKAARKALEKSLYQLESRNSPIKAWTIKFAQSIGSIYHSGTLDFRSFELKEQNATRALCSHYGTLENVVTKALDKGLAAAHRLLRQLNSDLQPVANYQFYALIAAMRNARSHFKCRPVDHDAELQPIAVWLWDFFLAGLKSLAAGQQPILAKQARLTNLKQAGASRWLPTSVFLDNSEGNEFCSLVIGRFGQLLRLGILDVSPELKSYADYALRLIQPG
jgi:hypothetical protein